MFGIALMMILAGLLYGFFFSNWFFMLAVAGVVVAARKEYCLSKHK